MIRTSAPLRLIIAGEWAILEPSSSGIAAAINCRYYCEIEENPQNLIEISHLDFNIKELTARFDNNELIFDQELSEDQKNNLQVMKFVIESALFHLNYFKPFKIRAWSEKIEKFSDSQQIDLEIGRSAAAIVATLAAIYSFYQVPLDDQRERERLFKLCLLSHFIIQDMHSSGIDVAASFHGGILQYKRFNINWVTEQIQNNLPIDVFIEYRWPDLEIKPLSILSDLHLLLGWTQIPVSPSELISRIEKYKKQNYAFYNEIISQLLKLVKDLSKAWRKGNESRILADIKVNQMYLRRLGEISGAPIEIPELQLLCHIADELGGAGKISGMGGGDCGIALCFDALISQNIVDSWEKNKILASEVKIDPQGLIIENLS